MWNFVFDHVNRLVNLAFALDLFLIEISSQNAKITNFGQFIRQSRLV